MQQVSENIFVYGNQELNLIDQNTLDQFVKIYLGGTQSMSKEGWRGKFVNGLLNLCNNSEQFKAFRFIILDPSYTPQNPTMDLSNPEFTQKLDNQNAMIRMADVIFFNILEKSQNPITLAELSAICATEANFPGRTVVRLPLKYQMFPYAKFICMRNNILTLGSPTVSDIINSFFMRNKRLNELINNGLNQ